MNPNTGSPITSIISVRTVIGRMIIPGCGINAGTGKSKVHATPVMIIPVIIPVMAATLRMQTLEHQQENGGY
jgi:hypothetical protein